MIAFGWGSNSHGQLGLGFTSEQEKYPVEIKKIILPLKSITGGGKHTELISNEETSACGANDKGQLRQECKEPVCNFQLPKNHFKTVVTKISCGWDFSLCLLDNYQVYGWGSNSYGQLGNSFVTETHEAIAVNIPPAVDIACGLRHAAVVTRTGEVFTSGSNSRCQLGASIGLKKSSLFQKVPDLQGVKLISCGENFCLCHSDSGEFVWGDNKFGQAGVSPKDFKQLIKPYPIHINWCTGDKLKNIFCGWTNCAILTDNGNVYTWGRNDYGQLGEHREFPWQPTCIKTDHKFLQLALGSHHTVGLTKNKEVIAWGWNEHGSCGDGTLENRQTPVKIELPPKFIPLSIGSGAAHSFVLGKLDSGKNSDTEMENIVEIAVDEKINSKLENDKIRVINSDAEFNVFFHNSLVTNQPCIIRNIGRDWPCFSLWVNENGKPNFDYLQKYNADVCVAQCHKKAFNVQEKINMTLSDYITYWKEYDSSDGACLYLKDWHFTRDFPIDKVYRVPKYFSSDWLGEYYDNHPELGDDYRFVYMGPKGSWTPLHMDVFSSYSWSINITGRKKWLLLKPGVEALFQDSFGNLNFDEDLHAPPDLSGVFIIEQNAGDAIFIPSGWHHQVWNLENTISINHNWVNGSNIYYMWDSMKKNFLQVQHEIRDCKTMEGWTDHCQLMLDALYGLNYPKFYSFIREIINSRINALKSSSTFSVFGEWSLGSNYLVYDLKQALTVLCMFKDDPHVVKLNLMDADESPFSLYNRLEQFLDSYVSPK